MGANDKLAKFVGLEAYTTAGGSVRKDLFGEERYLEDPELLNRLVSEKLDETKAKLEAEGWGWVGVGGERDYGYVAKHGRIKATATEVPAELVAEQKRLRAELNELQEREEPEDRTSHLDLKGMVRISEPHL